MIMRAIKCLLACLLGGTLFALSHCVLPVAGGTEGGNAELASLGGTAQLPDGNAATGAHVRVRRADYLADMPSQSLLKPLAVSFDLTTDLCGAFRADSVDTGTYLVEISSGRGLAIAIPCTLSRVGEFKSLGSPRLDTISVVQGISPILPDSGKDVFVQVFGLERVIPVASDGAFEISDIPHGIYRFRFASPASAIEPVTFDSVKAVSGDTVTIGTYALWQHQATVTVTTAAGGSEIFENLLSFPLLVRLDSSNFDFTQANALGEDLRCADRFQRPIPFEIETFDPLLKSAAIWVRIDTVFAGRADQMFNLCGHRRKNGVIPPV